MKKRLFASALAVLMLFGTVSSAAAAHLPDTSRRAARPNATTERTLPTELSRGAYTPKSSLDNPVKFTKNADERITVIVELKSEPLGRLTRSLAFRNGGSAGERTASSQAQSRQQTLVAEQNAVVSAFQKVDVSADVMHRYTGVFNGFSMEVRRGDLPALRADSRVKNVYISKTYDVPVTFPMADASSGDMIWINNMGGAHGLYGDGMIIAIVDTGLDYNHPLFRSLDSAEKTSQADMIAKVTGLLDSLNATGDADDLVHNDKVIFGYDYAENDTNPMDHEGHGTHVAGIAAANSDEEGVVFGVAPNAQVMTMKVFKDEGGGATDAAILAALDDVVKLGADVINMSLGSDTGFSSYDYYDAYLEDFSYEEIFGAIRESGTYLSISAGNAGTVGTDIPNWAGQRYPYAANPDYAMVGSPSTFADAVSVASVDNYVATRAYFKATPLGDEEVDQIFFSDSTIGGSFPVIFEDETLSYVTVPGFGLEHDFTDVDVANKVALIQRGGDVDFGLKVQNAQDAGAIAAVVYNHAAGGESLIGMDFSGYPDIDIPAIFIGNAAGAALAAAPSGTMTFDSDFWAKSLSVTGGLISDFSSRGPTPDLKIKPEISAPGGDIYSTWPTALGTYSTIGGTSMAAPHVAGAAVLLKQYAQEAFDLSGAELVERMENLLLSSAIPQGLWYRHDELEEFFETFPVTSQGSGMLDVDGALAAEAILYNTYDGKTKVELGDGLAPNEEFEVAFVLENITDAPVVYALYGEIYGDAYASIPGVFDFIYTGSDATSLWIDYESDMTGGGGEYIGDYYAVSVPANGKVTLTATFAFDDEYYDTELFPNGYYAYGYVYAIPVEENSYPISIPWLGFVGDWTDAPAFDGSNLYDFFWDEEADYMDSYYWENTAWGMFYDADDELAGYVLGINHYVPSDDPVDYVMPVEYLAFSPEGNGYNFFAPDIYLLRNLKHMWVEITDEGGRHVRTMLPWDYWFFTDLGEGGDPDTRVAYFPKAYVGNLLEMGLMWDGLDDGGNPVASDETYTFTVYGILDYAAKGKAALTPYGNAYHDSWSIDVYVDNDAPAVEGALDWEAGTITLSATDNHALAVLLAFDNEADDYLVYEYTDENDFTVEIDIDDLLDYGGYSSLGQALGSIFVAAEDFAGNYFEGFLVELIDFPIITAVSASKTYFAPGNQGDDATIGLTIDGANLEGVDLWASVFEPDAEEPWEIFDMIEDYVFDPADYEDDLAYLEDLYEEIYEGDVSWWEFIDVISGLHEGQNEVQFPSLLWIEGEDEEEEAIDLVFRAYPSAMPTVPGDYEIRVWINGDPDSVYVIPIVVTENPFVANPDASFLVDDPADLDFLVNFGRGDSVATEIVSVVSGDDELVAGEDYEVDGDTLKVYASYLNAHLGEAEEFDTLQLLVTFDDEESTEQTITITAVWTYFTVTFDANGGAPTPVAQTVRKGGTVTEPATPSRSNYTFTDWNLVVDGGTNVLWDFEEDTVESDITLIASWTYNAPTGGIPITPDTTPKPVVEQGDDGTTVTVEATATVTDDEVNATISDKLIDAAMQEAEKEDGPVVIEVAIPGIPADAEKASLTISGKAVGKIGAGGAGLSVNAQPLGTVTFSNEAAQALAEAAGNSDVVISITKVEEVTEELRDLIGDFPIYRVEVTVDGEVISDFGGGRIYIGIPFDADGRNPLAIIAYYVDEDGGVSIIRGSYDAKTEAMNIVTNHLTTFALGYNLVTFDDVANGAWFADAVTFLAAREIVGGVGDNMFDPNGNSTRAQFIAMVCRAYGIAPATGDNFADAGDTWYTGYLAAAKQSGISQGIGDNLFAPDREITRAEMFTLLYNALDYLGELPGGTGRDLSLFDDADSVADWALEAIGFMVENGIVVGSDNKIMPNNISGRSEMVQAFYNAYK